METCSLIDQGLKVTATGLLFPKKSKFVILVAACTRSQKISLDGTKLAVIVRLLKNLKAVIVLVLPNRET